MECVPPLLMSSGFLFGLCRVGYLLGYVEWVPHLLMSSGFRAFLCRVGSMLANVE